MLRVIAYQQQSPKQHSVILTWPFITCEFLDSSRNFVWILSFLGIVHFRIHFRVFLEGEERGFFSLQYLGASMLSHAWLLATPWTVTHQAPLSMGFSWQEYWNGLPLPTPKGSQPRDQTHVSCVSWIAGDSLLLNHRGKPLGGCGEN